MSHEFYQVMVGAPTMSLYSWKQLARWSIDYSCLNKDEQRRGHAILEKDWKKFCALIVEKYGDILEDGVIEKGVINSVVADRIYGDLNALC
jgi:adenosine deaminase CECR1